MYGIRRAETSAELEAVFRFRYEHYFRVFPEGFPGVDHARGRMFEAHDLDSEHVCATDAAGALLAVSTATPADAPSAPAAWTGWLALDRLRPLGLERLMVSTRMVLHSAERGGELFAFFYRALKRRYAAAGLLASLHYCRPGLVSRYQRLGHHGYAAPFNLPGGQLRQPMLVALNDAAGPEAAPGEASPLTTALPELAGPGQFHRLSVGERAAWVAERLRAAGAGALHPEGLPALRRASLLRVAPGQTLRAEPGEAQLCFILAGRFREELAGGEPCPGPGEFLGGGGGCAARAETAAELLAFDSTLVRRVLAAPDGPAPDAAALWRALGAATHARAACPAGAGEISRAN